MIDRTATPGWRLTTVWASIIRPSPYPAATNVNIMSSDVACSTRVGSLASERSGCNNWR